MLKLNVGLSRKVGEASYGSRGASVSLELEVESGLAADADALRDRVRQLFRMARVSVDEELNGNGTNGNGQANQHDNGNGSRRTNSRQATASQVRAIHAIANRNRLNLASELQSRFSVDRPDDLSISEASELIDGLKSQTNGNGARR
jgi:hypothetical protein